jgi:hypothetical protein
MKGLEETIGKWLLRRLQVRACRKVREENRGRGILDMWWQEVQQHCHLY